MGESIRLKSAAGEIGESEGGLGVGELADLPGDPPVRCGVHRLDAGHVAVVEGADEGVLAERPLHQIEGAAAGEVLEADAEAVGHAFGEYLKRTLTQSVSLREPKDVAWFLASYARDALARVEERGDVPALKAVRTALEDALGVHFEGSKGEHFFRSTLVQTLFYGVFSAWVLWSRQEPPPPQPFDWRTAVWHLRVPMLQALFQQVSDPAKLKTLGLVQLLDWAAAALNRVDRAEFFTRFRDAEAVQYFYEPFLEAFDPELRKELGVWYTPAEVVTYMVARADRALKEDLGLADGLAAENVYILDPCTGTGSFLGEVLRRIAANLDDKGLASRLDLRLAVATPASNGLLSGVVSADGWAVYGLTGGGQVSRTTPSGSWSFAPAPAARVLIPLPDGSLVLLHDDGSRSRLRRLRPQLPRRGRGRPRHPRLGPPRLRAGRGGPAPPSRRARGRGLRAARRAARRAGVRRGGARGRGRPADPGRTGPPSRRARHGQAVLARTARTRRRHAPDPVGQDPEVPAP